MSVFVSHNHILYDLLNILIGGFHCSIHLCLIHKRVMVFDLELHAEFSDHSVIEISTIVCDNPFGDAILTYKVMLNKHGDNILSDWGK